MEIKKRNQTPNINVFLFLSVLTILVFVPLFSRPALAHRVFVYAWVEGDSVFTESYFSGGQKVRGGLIEVFDSKGKKLLEGHTNEQGEFSFKPPEKQDLRIVLTATMGHKGEYLLKADEFGVSKGIENPAVPESKEATKAAPQEDKTVEAKEIRRIVEQVLGEKLGPLARSIAKLREEKGPGMTEVVGGIGYIFGLMGIVLYILSKKKN